MYDLIVDDINDYPSEWTFGNYGGLRFLGCIYDLDSDSLRWRVLDESTKHTIYLRGDKIYHDLYRIYCWRRIKKTISDYVSKYATC